MDRSHRPQNRKISFNFQPCETRFESFDHHTVSELNQENVTGGAGGNPVPVVPISEAATLVDGTDVLTPSRRPRPTIPLPATTVVVAAVGGAFSGSVPVAAVAGRTDAGAAAAA